MLDRFIYGSVSRISPEAPVPVLQIREQHSMLGGAGNAVRNLHALGCSVRFTSVVGEDAAAAEIESALVAMPKCQWFLAYELNRQTIVKTRYIADSQQVMRADAESKHEIAAEPFAAALERFQATLEGASVVLLSDYGKGLLTAGRAHAFIDLARARGIPSIVDPKGAAFRRYNGATVIKPNLKELAEATGMPVDTDQAREAAARALLADLDIEHLLVTCGASGMLLASRSGDLRWFPARAREVFDVSGAGDTAAAVLAAALGSGADVVDAVEAANLAAGVVVGKRGTAVVTVTELEQEVRQRTLTGASGKVFSLAELVDQVTQWRDAGLRIGFTNGCFDLLHPGHISLLETARANCDRLIVAINSDQSAARLKGRGLPAQNESTRALVLASLRPVDAVTIFEDDSPVDLIRQLRPDVLIKGREYAPTEVVGAELLPAWEGRLLLVDIVPGHSTARTLARLTGKEEA
jgi:D-beta-D-heptose 7-phosphate kinase/D-beta-D-heptose 1-phosphate adenosyltransferase